jgi:hypothetical protein
VGGEGLIRTPAEEEAARPGDRPESPLLKDLVARVTDMPSGVREAAVGILAGVDWRLHDAIQRHEFSHDELAHLFVLSRFGSQSRRHRWAARSSH